VIEFFCFFTGALLADHGDDCAHVTIEDVAVSVEEW